MEITTKHPDQQAAELARQAIKQAGKAVDKKCKIKRGTLKIRDISFWDWLARLFGA